MRLSKRECVLLTVLVVLLIWYVGAGRILEPAAERRREAEGRLEQVEYQRACVETYLSKGEVDAGKASAGDVLAEDVLAEDSGEFFFAEMDDVTADRLLQDMAAKAGVRIRKMEIGAAEPFPEENGLTEKNGLTEENGLPEAEGIRSDEAQSAGGEPSPGDLMVRRMPVYLELSAQTPGMIAGFAEQIDSSPASMSVDYMEIKEPRPGATKSEAGSEVRCSMDVSFYWIERQRAGEDS